MPFQKGHPYYPPADGPSLPGRPRPVVRALRSLAMVIRENMPPEEMFRWLRLVAAGIDPDAAPAKGDPNGSVSQTPIDMDIRVRAMKMLLERALGQPPQFVHMEADVKSQTQVQVQAVDPAAVRGLSTEQLRGLSDTLRALLGQGASPRVIEAQEVPARSHAVIDAQEVPPRAEAHDAESSRGSGNAATVPRVP